MNNGSTVNSFSAPGDYRIEISGWALDNSFFVERTDLLWTADGQKLVQLRCPLPEGAMVFVRLLSLEVSSGSVPVAYRVRGVVPMNSQGRYRMKLLQMHPRCKESLGANPASYGAEDLQGVCDATKAEAELQYEEILQ
jgi:hypothetical protein